MGPGAQCRSRGATVVRRCVLSDLTPTGSRPALRRAAEAAINILIAVNSLEKGGRTKRIVDEYLGLQARGHAVTLISFSTPPPWVLRHYPNSDQWQVIPKRRTKLDVLLLLGLMRAIRACQADVVHSHCETSAFYAGLAGRLCGVPTVGTVHRSELRYYRPTWRNRMFYRFLDGYIAVSDERRQRMESDLGLPSDRIERIHWGVDPASVVLTVDAAALRARLGIPDGRILFGLGHLGPIKGHDDTIRAMTLLRSRFPDLRLYIAGDGTVADHERLHDLIEAEALQGAVVLLGQITNALEWMQLCEVFILPSREEAFGLVFIEAGLCSKPTVATAVGGIPEIIEDGVTGLLVPVKSPDAIADRVAHLLASPAQAQAMGAAAHRRVMSLFVLDQQIDHLERHLCRLAGIPKA